MHPEKIVTLKVKARQKDDRESIAFSLKWRKQVGVEPSSRLNITYEEPETAPEEEPGPTSWD